jgi:hypothetical protein
MSAYEKGWKASARKAAKDAGHFDGRFSPKVYVDRYKESSRLGCRGKILLDEREEEERLDATSSDDFFSALGWDETPCFQPLQTLDPKRN